MSKVNLKRDAPLDKTTSDFYKGIRSRYTKQKFCKIMGYKSATDCDRVNHPEMFRLEELRKLYREGEEIFSRTALDEIFLKMIRED